MNASGDLIVPVNRIPEHVKRNKYFNPRNYILPEKFSAIKKMAEANVARRFEERHKKFKSELRSFSTAICAFSSNL